MADLNLGWIIHWLRSSAHDDDSNFYFVKSEIIDIIFMLQFSSARASEPIEPDIH